MHQCKSLGDFIEEWIFTIIFQCNFNDIGSPNASKRRLYFSWGKFLKVLKSLAAERSLKFPDSMGAKELCLHYDQVWQDLGTLGQNLKLATQQDKLDKDELHADEDRAKRDR